MFCRFTVLIHSVVELSLYFSKFDSNIDDVFDDLGSIDSLSINQKKRHLYSDQFMLMYINNTNLFISIRCKLIAPEAELSFFSLCMKSYLVASGVSTIFPSMK